LGRDAVILRRCRGRVAALALVVTTALAGSASADAAPGCWSKPVVVTGGKREALLDGLAATAGGRVAAMWVKQLPSGANPLSSPSAENVGMVDVGSLHLIRRRSLPRLGPQPGFGQLVATPSGDVVAAWRVPRKSQASSGPELYWSRLRAGRGNWSRPRPLPYHRGDEGADLQLVAMPDDGVAAFWYAPGASSPTQGLLTATLAAGADDWSAATLMRRASVNTDIKPSVAVAPDGTSTVVWGLPGDRHVYTKRPGQHGWSNRPFAPRAEIVALTQGADGTLVASWTERVGIDGSIAKVAVRRPGVSSFSPPQRLTPVIKNVAASLPAVVVGSDGAATLVTAVARLSHRAVATLRARSPRAHTTGVRVFILRSRDHRFTRIAPPAALRHSVTEFTLLADGTALAINNPSEGPSGTQSLSTGSSLITSRGRPGSKAWGRAHTLAPPAAHWNMKSVALPDGGAVVGWTDSLLESRRISLVELRATRTCQ
jgi:hypothetical protein